MVYCLYKIKLNIKKGRRVKKKLNMKGKYFFRNSPLKFFNVFLKEFHLITSLINKESNMATNNNP